MKHLIGLITKGTLPLFSIIMVVIISFGLFGLSYGKNLSGVNEICLECHLDISKKMEAEKVHQPVKEGKCTECHNPHTSRHSGLLNDVSDKLCFQCHEKDKGFAEPFVHGPVKDGECLSCHQHHSSIHEGLLKKAAAEVCFECHPEEEIITRDIVHQPVKEGKCTKCHNPHSSTEERLLVKDNLRLCVGCHYSKDSTFVQSHKGYSVIPSDCLSCHSPHSSDKKGILRANLHKPFAEGECSVCHNPPTLAGSIEVLKDGVNLCIGCHEDTKEGFYKMYSHLIPGIETNICNNCHTPHASDGKGLLRDKEDRVCYKCHSDTKMYVAEAKVKHPDIERCSDCHAPHGSNNEFFLILGEEGQCSAEQCHPVQGRFTHPVGEEIIDPRSRRPMTCTTCHNPMGTPEKFILRAGKDKELCTKCHQM